MLKVAIAACRGPEKVRGKKECFPDDHCSVYSKPYSLIQYLRGKYHPADTEADAGRYRFCTAYKWELRFNSSSRF